jgi:predicted AAA+ superfamily ATPase
VNAADDVPRSLHPLIRNALLDTRVVGVVGPRQAGKSTLAQQLVRGRAGATYVSLDDADVRAAVSADAQGFVLDRPGLLAIDEIQRVPELLLAIKAAVDADQRPGRFLITGSSQLSANRGVSETLAGRIERFELWPLSQSELTGTRGTFIDALFADKPALDGSNLTKLDYLRCAAAGGFPEALRRAPSRRAAWFDAYVETVVEREAPGISASPRTADLPRLLRLMAARHGGLLNVADLARDSAIPQRTLHRYVEVLEAVFLIRRLPAWAANRTQREIRAPKVFITDPGLATHLRGLDPQTLARPELAKGADGPVLEGFVFAELLRQVAWSSSGYQLFHYRERDGTEIDLLAEDRAGRIVAVEVKASSDVSGRDVRHLTSFRDRLGDRFVAGVVLHTGSRGLPLGDRLAALPVASIWSGPGGIR